MNKKDLIRPNKISRREFLNTSAVAAGAVLAQPLLKTGLLEDFPTADRLGRIAVGMVDIKFRPDYDAPTVGTYYEDTIVPWLREVIGPWPNRNNQRWVETPDGYIWGDNCPPLFSPELRLACSLWFGLQCCHCGHSFALPPAARGVQPSLRGSYRGGVTGGCAIAWTKGDALPVYDEP
ncbi:MAG: hypothetical protein MUO54_01165, partial [Anaerolineales bacterium]|nr:hypothetical protein [Anaerolineales bacterium]